MISPEAQQPAVNTLRKGKNCPEKWGKASPFTGSTFVRFHLGERMSVRVDLVDATGRKVANLLAGERAAGEHRLQIDARGLRLAAWVYFCRVSAGNETASERLVVTR